MKTRVENPIDGYSGIVLLRFINYLYFVHVKYSILSMECSRIFSRFLGIIDEPVQWIIK